MPLVIPDDNDLLEFLFPFVIAFVELRSLISVCVSFKIASLYDENRGMKRFIMFNCSVTIVHHLPLRFHHHGRSCALSSNTGIINGQTFTPVSQSKVCPYSKGLQSKLLQAERAPRIGRQK